MKARDDDDSGQGDELKGYFYNYLYLYPLDRMEEKLCTACTLPWHFEQRCRPVMMSFTKRLIIMNSQI